MSKMPARFLQHRWEFAPESLPSPVAELARALRVSEVAARIIAARGMTDAGRADDFFSRDMRRLHDPALLPGMGVAVARIARAIERKEKIVLFGDYDADGVTATALLARYFEFLARTPSLRTCCEALVPERKNGYGLSAAALSEIIARKPALLITLDNGIAAVEAVDILNAEGIDCIIVDHHLPGALIPRAVAVVNPKRTDIAHGYPFAELCGAGLSFKLAWALSVHYSNDKKVTAEFRQFLLEAMALAAVGTVADVVPLVDENRILVHHGLKFLALTRNLGMRALLEGTRLLPLEVGQRDSISPGDVGFRLGPRLNAAGRCGRAADALELLLTADAGRAQELAAALELLNSERQKIEEKILDEARAQASAALAARPQCRGFVLHSELWHQGVIGIAASRIVEEFHRPAVLLAVDSSGMAHGSGRSIRCLNLHQALHESQTHLLRFGGHAAAAGVTIQAGNIELFRIEFEGVLHRLVAEDDLAPRLHVDARVTMRELNTQLCADLEKFEPCGMGNPRPMLALSGAELPSPPRLMGRDEKHVSFFARQGTHARRVVGFHFAEHFNALSDMVQRKTVDLAFRPQLNTFKGESNVELVLEAYRATSDTSVVPLSP